MKQTTISQVWKKLLLLLWLGALLVPVLQFRYSFLEEPPLGGYSATHDRPSGHISCWMSGDYQQQAEQWWSIHFGFRSSFVRMYNQLYFDLFHTARANGVVVGKEDYLFEENYLLALNGGDFVGEDSIHAVVHRLERLSAELAVDGIPLLFVLVPGKGSYYSEYIPDDYLAGDEVVTNVGVYRDALHQSSLHFLDLSEWFVEAKDTTRYPLFPKTGIHWSRYGAVKATDTLTKHLNSLLKIDGPTLEFTGISVRDSMEYSDDDIERAMNLWFDIEDVPMAYPELTYTTDSVYLPKAVVIGDSFYWTLVECGITNRYFDNARFWYYFQEEHWKEPGVTTPISEIAVWQALRQSDVVVVMVTEGNLQRGVYGFDQVALGLEK